MGMPLDELLTRRFEREDPDRHDEAGFLREADEVVGRVWRPFSDSATRRLAVTYTSPSASVIGRETADAMRSASAWAASSSGTSLHSTVNSSPPNRATVSLGRIVARSRSAIATRSRSPAGCPRLSLTTLK